MRKLLVVLLCAGTLAACSTSKEPQPAAPQNPTLAISDCSEAKQFVKNNNTKIAQAFATRDATAIGTLELQNRDVVHEHMGCFPKIKKQIETWKKLHKNGDM
jgi:hypothetical protein